MTGRAGADADAFLFSTVLNGLNNVDAITDYTVGSDHIQLARSIFAPRGAAGVLNADQFHFGTAAADANDHIIYDSATGKLYYDSDGTGSAQQVQFAVLDPGLVLPNQDFLLI